MITGRLEGVEDSVKLMKQMQTRWKMRKIKTIRKPMKNVALDKKKVPKTRRSQE